MIKQVYTIALDGSQPVRFHSCGYRNADAGHRHISRPSLFKHEIILVEEGILNIKVDGTMIEAKAGTVIFNKAGLHQDGNKPSPGRIRYIWMHFDAVVVGIPSKKEQILKIRKQVAVSLANRSPVRTAVVPLVFVPRHMGEILELGHQLAAPSPWLEPEKSALVIALLCRMTRSYLWQREEENHLVADIRAYMQGMLINPELAGLLSVRHLAQHFNRNPDYLNRQFCRFAGTTLAHEIVRLRVEEAKRRLAQKWTVKEAARLSGYANAKYLARQFKRMTGIPPSEFRTWKSAP